MNSENAAVYTKLQGGTALTSLLSSTVAIYHQQAPEGAVLPYVVFSTQSETEPNDTSHRVKNFVLYVRAYSGVSAAQAGSIDAQCDLLLHNQSLNVTGYTHIWLAREQGFELPEMAPSGKTVYMAGGYYRSIVEKN